ncbi:MAG: GntR family transcriptional regulator [Anaerolineales bacterium]
MYRKPNGIVAGSIPKYRQLLIILRNQILKGELEPGQRIPSEEELIGTYGLSRGTVRKAIAQLETERLIETEHGVGSFVRALHPNAVPFQFVTPPEATEAAGVETSYQVLAQEVIPAPVDIADKLKLPPGEAIIHIARRELVSGQVVSYSERFLLEDILPDLVHEDLTRVGSIHDLLVAASAYPLLRAEIEIEAHLINEQEAQLLEAGPGDPAIVVNRITYTAPNRPAVWYSGLFKSQYHIAVGIS